MNELELALDDNYRAHRLARVGAEDALKTLTADMGGSMVESAARQGLLSMIRIGKKQEAKAKTIRELLFKPTESDQVKS